MILPRLFTAKACGYFLPLNYAANQRYFWLDLEALHRFRLFYFRHFVLPAVLDTPTQSFMAQTRLSNFYHMELDDAHFLFLPCALQA